MTYVVVTPRGRYDVNGEPRMTFRQILAQLPSVTFPLAINGYKVLERDNLDRTMPAVW